MNRMMQRFGQSLLNDNLHLYFENKKRKAFAAHFLFDNFSVFINTSSETSEMTLAVLRNFMLKNGNEFPDLLNRYLDVIAKNQLTELKKITTSINAFVGAAKYGIASSNVVQTGYKASLGTFQNLLDEKIPQGMKKSENYRTGTDEMVNKLQDLLKISGIGDYISELTTNTKTYLETLGSGIKNVFGSGGVDTEYAANNYGIPQQTNTINTNLPNQKIETENNIKVDFKVTTDENILPKTKEDINTAINYYFNGPDGPSHIQMLLNLMPKEATSNGLIKKP
jgi:hypothetical protein